LNIEGCIVLIACDLLVGFEQRPTSGLQCAFQTSNAHDPLVLPGKEPGRADATTLVATRRDNPLSRSMPAHHGWAGLPNEINALWMRTSAWPLGQFVDRFRSAQASRCVVHSLGSSSLASRSDQ
jgi:hypothetical protein